MNGPFHVTHSQRWMFLTTLLCAAIAFGVCTRPASASTITWEYDLRVHGNAFTPSPGLGVPGTPVVVPNGTPLTINLSFDSGTPNDCANPASQGGVYLISGGNHANVDFLGFEYGGFGGIEVGNLGPCGGNGVASGLRLFLGSGSQIDPAGTPIVWPSIPGFGTMFVFGPDAPAPGALPTTLPTNPFPTGANIFPGNSFQLFVESAQIRAVVATPEPLSGVLVATGLVITGARRRRTRRK